MNRLQKKCFIASAGAHLLLALILFVGPGFMSTQSKTEDMPVLDFIPVKTVDALVSGGGNPNAKPPPAAPAPQPPPPAPAPQPPPPAPEPVREPKPPKESVKEIKPAKPAPDSLELSRKRKPRKPKISLKPVVRSTRDTRAEARARAEAQARAQDRAWTDARKRLAREFGRVAERIGGEMSGATTIELKGPGGGGVPYANFLNAVQSAYDRAWVVPDGAADSEAVTTASVTIARDGTVVSARIIRRSRNPAVDQSVQATLDRVTYAAPLPDDAKENQRTVTIRFKARPRQGIG